RWLPLRSNRIGTLENAKRSAKIRSTQKKAPRIFQRIAFVSRRGSATQLQETQDRLRRSPAPSIQSRPRQPRPSNRPRTRSTYSRSAGNGSLRNVGRRTPSDAAQD